MKHIPTSDNDQSFVNEVEVIKEENSLEDLRKKEPSSSTSKSRGSIELENFRKISSLSSNKSNQKLISTPFSE